MIETHVAILRALVVLSDESEWGEDGFFAFIRIQKKTGMPRNVTRRIVRHLARRGMTEFSSGLWDMDGNPGGSGYRITCAGRAKLAELEDGTSAQKLAREFLKAADAALTKMEAGE